jgi:hypothetical protein
LKKIGKKVAPSEAISYL